MSTLASEATHPLRNLETTEVIQLIDGNFSVPEATEVLVELINHKIHFHQMRNFSWEERFGKPNPQSQKRLRELSKERDRILAVIDFAAENGMTLDVQSKIEIRLSK